MVPVSRALVSVSDKTGLIDFARALAELGVELLSTGGTGAALAAAGIPATDVSAVTGFPEMMDGRVKTLHPKIHGGLLALRNDPEHAAAMAAHGIAGIDLLIVNLYPFEEALKRKLSHPEMIENIDIGGPAMIRAAAKNHGYVTVVVEPEDYDFVLKALKEHGGATPLKLREMLAAKAFARTSSYDAAIAGYMARYTGESSLAFGALSGRRVEVLRYGENPHQTATLWASGDARPGVVSAKQLQGKELSYNNINDTDAAFELVAEFDPDRTAAVAIIKHANPCCLPQGLALGSGFRLRRDRRPQPPARRRGGNRDREDFYRGHHRAGRRRRRPGNRRRKEEPAAPHHRRAPRSHPARPRLPLGRRRLSHPEPRFGNGRR